MASTVAGAGAAAIAVAVESQRAEARRTVMARRGSCSLRDVHGALPLRGAAGAAVSTPRGRPSRGASGGTEIVGAGWFWARHAEEGYIAVRPTGAPAGLGGALPCHEFGGGGVVGVAPGDMGPEITHPSLLVDSFDDMVKMEEVTEQSILHNLKLR